MVNKQELRSAIYRSERAYQLYSQEKLFFQAIRIYKANEIIYNKLQEYQLFCPLEEQENVCNYIFHLEDWMVQFEYSKQKINNPNESFIFDRWYGAISFPKDFINNLTIK